MELAVHWRNTVPKLALGTAGLTTNILLKAAATKTWTGAKAGVNQAATQDGTLYS
jgi:hypothetical protein